ncbi:MULTISPECIES: hypothetical protein [Enterobacter]|uniref:hypothetical protein n=1 Tax=Enterobacter TaxID=547 RepID=UPI00075096FB|nr:MULTISPECIES: hypothetical protein [Enterobacter]AYA11475.1 hypothetical protein AM452_08340 [Enterobacter cloacae]KUQ08564.1 hypothetical protein AWI07_13045 [Enterobacter roggenkampii]MBW9389454.1 hypothetical protein [Enterobacter sp. EC_62]MBW9445345.1 hypothetical protein [Enterobacter sp. EC_50]MDU7153888.1 hypothetical protein [Enterobacter sp.]
MESVKAVIKKANINVAVMGNKAFKDAKEANPKLHHMSAEGKALLCSFDQRKAEAVKFAPFIKVNDSAEQEPAITKSDVVKWFEQEGLSLTINDFSKMLEGTRAAAEPRAKRGEAKAAKAAPMFQAVAQPATEGVTITTAQHEFFNVLLELVKRDAPAILTAAYTEIQRRKIEAAQARILAELEAEMGGLAAMIPQPEQEASKWEYDAEIIAKAQAALDRATAGEKVPAKTIAVAKLVLAGAATDDAQQALLG